MDETSFWVSGAFVGAVAVGAAYRGDVIVAVAAAAIALILMITAVRARRGR